MSSETDRIIALNCAPTIMTYEKSFVGFMEQCHDGEWCRKDDVDAAWDERIKELNQLYEGRAIKANNEHYVAIKKLNTNHYEAIKSLNRKISELVRSITQADDKEAARKSKLRVKRNKLWCLFAAVGLSWGFFISVILGVLRA